MTAFEIGSEVVVAQIDEIRVQQNEPRRPPAALTQVEARRNEHGPAVALEMFLTCRVDCDSNDRRCRQSEEAVKHTMLPVLIALTDRPDRLAWQYGLARSVGQTCGGSYVLDHRGPR